MKKRIVILILLVFAITTTMIMVPQVKAATVIIHDHLTESRIWSRDQCSEYINAWDGRKFPAYDKPHTAFDGNIWLRNHFPPGGSVLVNFTTASSVVIVQYHSSDNNDGCTDIFVDDMVNPVARIDTYMRGHWYVEIQDLPNTLHTVKVHVSETTTGATPSPHRGTPTLGDNDVWYFGIPGLPVGGIAIPIDRLGLLAPYIGLASTIVVATAATAIYVKRAKHRKEKQ